MNDIYKSVLGCFLGAAVGDAMGAPTETMPIAYIKKYYNGYVKSFLECPNFVISAGRNVGCVTDDFSLAYYLAKEIIKSEGEISTAVSDKSILSWYEAEIYNDMLGPTLWERICLLKSDKKTSQKNLFIDNNNATNGAAMKVFPAGLISGGSVDKAINNAILLSENSHPNSSALAGACAISASISKAISCTDLNAIVEAGLKGAREGDRYGCKIGKQLATPSVERNITFAVEIALKNNDLEKTMYEISSLIGSSMMIHQTISAVYGILVAAKGKTMNSILGGVNIGNDTDTIASIIGAIVGTMNKFDSFPKDYITIINQANGYDLCKLAKDFCKYLQKS